MYGKKRNEFDKGRRRLSSREGTIFFFYIYKKRYDGFYEEENKNYYNSIFFTFVERSSSASQRYWRALLASDDSASTSAAADTAIAVPSKGTAAPRLRLFSRSLFFFLLLNILLLSHTREGFSQRVFWSVRGVFRGSRSVPHTERRSDFRIRKRGINKNEKRKKKRYTADSAAI